LRPTISRPVRRGVRAPCGVHDQILIFFVWQLLSFSYMQDALSDERTGQ
jgi:hypothetical protein